MATRIRLTRLGDKGSPFYRVVVADSRSPRDGKVIASLGTFDPLKNDIKLDKDATLDWLSKGALPTDTAKSVLIKAEIIKPDKPKTKEKTTAKKPETKKVKE